MSEKFIQHLQDQLSQIKESGLYKNEHLIASPQGPEVTLKNGEKVIIMCANNYLGLSSNPRIIESAHKVLDEYGYGMSSVRFICGTQTIHKTLEEKISTFLGKEDTILYAAAFDANGGIFEPLFTNEDAIISDELNHASIIDGVRLCKAVRYRYQNGNMESLEEQLKKAQSQRHRIIVTDGVFSMDGNIAPLKEIVQLARKYDALVMVDDSHATGFMGKRGRGTHEHHEVMDEVDIITSTLGKAMGGAMGGFTSGKKEVIELLRQRSRPYLFSNSLTPVIVGASMAVVDMLTESTELRDRLMDNTDYFKTGMRQIGLDIKEGGSPIVPIMLHDAKLSQKFASSLLQKGVYAVGFFYPVVPREQARIRVQISAAHTRDHLDKAIGAFEAVGKELAII